MTLSPERRKHIIRVICDLYGYDMEYAINHTLALAEQADEGRCILCIEHDEPCDDCVAGAIKSCPDCEGSGKVVALSSDTHSKHPYSYSTERPCPDCGGSGVLHFSAGALQPEGYRVPCHCTKGESDE